MLLSGITSLGKTVLLVVAITFIAWAIVTAIFVPKRNPRFPRRLDAYILVSVLLFVAQMTAVVWVTGTQEVEEAHASEAEGEPGATTEEPAAGSTAVGKEVFESAGCATCHTLADAGASGSVGPNLDEAKPAQAPRRRAGHERDGRHARVQGSALRGADPGGRRVRLGGRRRVVRIPFGTGSRRPEGGRLLAYHWTTRLRGP